MKARILSRAPSPNNGRAILVVPGQPRDKLSSFRQIVKDLIDYLREAPNKNVLRFFERSVNHGNEPGDIIVSFAPDALVVPRVKHHGLNIILDEADGV